jgi:two-component system response regulator MprA
MRVLVIDDDRALRDALRRALVLAGYEVQAAENGLEGLQRVDETRPDVIVLDVMMPDLDGLEVSRRLRSLGDRTPILMLTARDAVEDRIDGLDAGADDYLVKPFDVGELTARVRALLRRTRAELSGEGLRFGDLELDAGRPGQGLAIRWSS